MSESTETARQEERKAAAPPAEANPEHAHGDHHEHDQYPFLAHHFDTPEHQFESGKFGIWIFLVTEVLFFAGLFCAYSVYRGMHPEIFYWAHFYLDTNLGAVNTIVLIVSSFTAAWAVRNAQLNQRRLLITNIVVTILCALTFMSVKYVEYSHKFHDGLLWGGRPTAAGQDPKYKFDPHHHVWELHEFEHKHPAAAAAAHRLYAAAHPEAAAHGEHAEPGADPAKPATSGSAAPSTSASAEGSTSAASTDSAAAPPVAVAGSASATLAPSSPENGPAAGGAAAVAARQSEGGAPTATSTASDTESLAGNAAAEGGSPPVEVSDAEATAAIAALAEMAGADQRAADAKKHELENPVRALTEEEALPLMRAGVIGPNAVTPTVPSHPKNAHIFFGIYFFMTGLHGLHVMGGIVVWLWLLRRALRGEFGPKYFGPIDYAALYWHLVDLVWIYLFPLLYLIH